MFSQIVYAATAAVTMSVVTSNGATAPIDQTSVYLDHGYRDRFDRRESGRISFCFLAAECSSPPPCPVELASLPMPPLVPPEARTGATWLARMQGAARERRALRDGVEKKDARLTY
jgi:hypothetical protein